MANSVNLGTVYASLELRLDKMQAGIRNAKRELSGFEASLKKTADATKRMGQTMSLSITAPLLLLGKQSVDAAAKMDSLRRSLTAIMGSADLAGKELVKLREVAKLPGLGMAEAAEGSIRLQNMGASAEEARRMLLAFGNAVARAGGGKAQLDGVTLALGQMLAKGKVSMEEVMQLAERGIPVFEALKRSFGTADTEALQKQGITGQQVVAALTKDFEGFERVTGGAQNSLENFGQSLTDLKTAIGEALLPTLIRWMEDLTPKIEAAMRWFGKLDESQKTLFTNMAVALAASGPLMVGLAALINSLVTINGALLTLARNPLIVALLAAGAGTAFFAGGGGDVIERGMNRWLDNFKASLGIKGAKPPMPVVGPFAQREALGNPLHQIMPSGPLSLQDFMPFAKAKPGKPSPTKKPPPRVLTAEERKRLEYMAEYSLQAKIELLELTGHPFRAREERARLEREEAIEKGASVAEADRVFAAKRKQIWAEYAEWKADKEKKLASQQMQAAGEAWEYEKSLLKQRQAAILQIQEGYNAIRNLITGYGPAGNIVRGNMPELSREFLEIIKRPGIKAAKEAPLPEELAKQIQDAFDKAEAALTPKPFSPEVRELVAESLIDADAIAHQLRKATEMSQTQRIATEFGKDLGSNLAYELGREFSEAFDKVFGTGNPLSRALNRTFTRLLDDLLYNAFSTGFGGKGLEGLFGGGIAQGGIDPMTGNPRSGGMGGMGTIGGIISLVGLFASGGIFKGIGKALSGIFRADGGPVRYGMPYIVGERGPEWFVPRQSGTVVPAGVGGVTINIPGMVVRSEADIDRLAWRIDQRMRARSGSG